MKGEERGKGAVGTLTWRGGATLSGRNSGGPRLGRTGPLTGRGRDRTNPRQAETRAGRDLTGCDSLGKELRRAEARTDRTLDGPSPG